MAASKLNKASSSVVPLSMDDSMMMKPMSVDKLAAKKILLVPLFISVKVACILALVSAVVLAAFAADSLIKRPCDPAVSYSGGWCIELTDAAEAKVAALKRGQLWVSGIQAAAALLGLLLSGRRSMALAFTELTIGAASLCIEAVVDAILITAAPGNHDFKMDTIASVVIFAVLDLIGFIVLILGQIFLDHE